MDRLCRRYGRRGGALRARLGTRSRRAGARPAALARLPLRFESNQGQWQPGVRFRARTGGYTLSLTDRGAVLGAAGGRNVEISMLGANPAPAIEPGRTATGPHQLFLGPREQLAHRRGQLFAGALPRRLSGHRRGLLRRTAAVGIRFRAGAGRRSARHPHGISRRGPRARHSRRRPGSGSGGRPRAAKETR